MRYRVFYGTNTFTTNTITNNGASGPAVSYLWDTI